MLIPNVQFSYTEKSSAVSFGNILNEDSIVSNIWTVFMESLELENNISAYILPFKIVAYSVNCWKGIDSLFIVPVNVIVGCSPR